ncbi:MAG: hypothetical protein B5M55_04635, partial [Desulfococcus sp. 4484_242]
MSTSKDPAEEYFRELHIPTLKHHAEIWFKKFHEAPIRRILLYGFISPYEGEMAARLEEEFMAFPYKYAVVFELDAEDKTVGMTGEKRMEYDLQKIGGKRDLEPYERLLDATEPDSRKPYEKRYRYFITAAFTNVYRRLVRDIDPRRKDWFFT